MEENVIELKENENGVAVAAEEEQTGNWLSRNKRKIGLAIVACVAAVAGAKRQYQKGKADGYEEALDDIESMSNNEETTETDEAPE